MTALLSTSLHLALSGVESGPRCAISKGPAFESPYCYCGVVTR